MKKKKLSPDKRKLLLALSMIDLVVIILLVFNASIPGLSISELSCSGDNIWIKYTLADEGSRLSDLIQDCDDNPAGGWVGEVDFYARLPSGEEKHLGGYQASEASSQKINCGVSSQSGKTFAGGYVPNEGFGYYDVQVEGTYYLSSENYATPHEFSWTKTANVQCVLPSSTCPDGTALRTCSDVQTGKYCGADAKLYDKASKCGCPVGMRESANECVPIVNEEPEEDYEPSPYGSTPPEETTTTTTTTTETTTTETTTTPPPTTETTYFGISVTIIIIVLLVLLIIMALMLMGVIV